MPKVDTQNIPSELLEPYKSTMTTEYNWKTTGSVRKRNAFRNKTLRDKRSLQRVY
jgi:hypothetical protein